MRQRAGFVVSRLALALAAALSACASPVAGINDRAMLARADDVAMRGEGTPIADAWTRPARTEYLIGSQDLLEIEIYELEEPNKGKVLKTRVTQDGHVVLPLIGAVAAKGKTAIELQTDVRDRLGKDFLVDPTVSVLVAEYHARQVTVLGAVKTPGTFTLRQNSTTLLDVLALAGGLVEQAGETVYVVCAGAEGDPVASAAGRAGAQAAEAGAAAAAGSNGATGPVEGHASRRRVARIDLDDLVKRGNLALNCALEDGDVVHVPPAEQVFVMGEVNKGGSFPLRGEITVMRAIALAGGIKTDANPSSTVLYRKTRDGREMIPLDLNEIEAGSNKDLVLKPDDVLVINEGGGIRFVRGLVSAVRGLFHVGYNLN